jgi:hypothetical protein
MQSGNFLNDIGQGMGAGSIGAGLWGLFGNDSNPANGAQGYLSQIPGAISPYYNPYINAGSGALSNLQGQYGNLLNNPGGMLNQIGSSYHQSPGFQFALQQALQGSGHAAAAGGMAGSPQHEQQNMQLATNIGNQDYYNFLNPAIGLYGQGLQGEQGLATMGFGAATNMSDQIAQALANQAGLSYAGKAAQNQSQGSAFSNIFGGLGMLGAFGGL